MTPPEGVNEATLTIRVRDPAGIDFEMARGKCGSAVERGGEGECWELGLISDGAASRWG